MKRENFEDYVSMMLENEDLETFLERFDLTSLEAIMLLYDHGLIDFELGVPFDLIDEELTDD